MVAQVAGQLDEVSVDIDSRCCAVAVTERGVGVCVVLLLLLLVMSRGGTGVRGFGGGNPF